VHRADTRGRRRDTFVQCGLTEGRGDPGR
jgi:hypothetical protein